MAFLTRDAILAAVDLPTESVSVPEWGGEVLVRGFTGTERDDFEAETYKGNGPDSKTNWHNLRARLLARTIVNEAGDRLFTDSDIALLGAKSAAAMDRVADVSQRLCGLGSKAVETLAKNSDGDPAAVSPSSSPEPSGG